MSILTKEDFLKYLRRNAEENEKTEEHKDEMENICEEPKKKGKKSQTKQKEKIQTKTKQSKTKPELETEETEDIQEPVYTMPRKILIF